MTQPVPDPYRVMYEEMAEDHARLIDRYAELRRMYEELAEDHAELRRLYVLRGDELARDR